MSQLKSVETGRVIRWGAGYGFIKTEAGDEIFAHLNDFRRAIEIKGQDSPAFGGSVADWEEADFPRPADVVVFHRLEAPRGDRAKPWTFASAWNQVADRIEHRATAPVEVKTAATALAAGIGSTKQVEPLRQPRIAASA